MLDFEKLNGWRSSLVFWGYDPAGFCQPLAQQELCVGDLAVTVGMSESAVSHQLRILRAIRLLATASKTTCFHRLQDRHVLISIRRVAEHPDEPGD